jgi:hypothetical protein
LVHGKPGIASREVGKAGAAIDGFAIDIEEAKSLRDIQQRLSVFLRKRYGPSELPTPVLVGDRLPFLDNSAFPVATSSALLAQLAT